LQDSFAVPTIVFASPKGGAGKSTAALLLATELALKGAGVTILDADPNKPMSQWASASAWNSSGVRIDLAGGRQTTASGMPYEPSTISSISVRTPQDDAVVGELFGCTDR
jgi:cellulose biosynthesis protein BcsQ